MIMWFLLVLLIIILIIAAMSIKIVKQSEVYIIERLGKFYKVADAGLTIIVPSCKKCSKFKTTNNGCSTSRSYYKR